MGMADILVMWPAHLFPYPNETPYETWFWLAPGFWEEMFEECG